LKPRLLVALLVVVLAVAGCARSPAPDPGPRAPDDRSGAPRIEAPRDVAPFAAAPCNGPLSTADLRDVGLATAGRPTRLVTGVNSCTWENYETEQAVSLVVYPSRDILVDTYRTRLFALFAPVVVQGLPAVREQSNADATACTITVGTAEGQGFVATYTQLEVAAGERPDDPCGRGQRIVEQIVAKLPPAPGRSR
jgi:hypothetical protein